MMTTSRSDSNWFPITVTEQQTALEVLVIPSSEAQTGLRPEKVKIFSSRREMFTDH